MKTNTGFSRLFGERNILCACAYVDERLTNFEIARAFLTL